MSPEDQKYKTKISSAVLVGSVEPSINQMSFITSKVLSINEKLIMSLDLKKSWPYNFDPQLTYCMNIHLT